MMKLAMSPAAAALLRALLARAGVERDRILLTQFRSVDWNSLTFSGERLDDAEFAIPGQIVADITVAGSPVRSADGSLSIKIEALTVAE